MTRLAKHPFIYEINTWVWLRELSNTYDRSASLADVPSWDALADLGADAVWLMGVWERSPAGIRIAMTNDTLLESFRQALPDFTAEDIVGSPYCVRRYVVDNQLGGRKGQSKQVLLYYSYIQWKLDSFHTLLIPRVLAFS